MSFALNIHLGWPQIIYLMLLALSLIGEASLHGKPKKGEYNFFSSLLIAVLMLFVFWWGGFFSG